VWVYVKLIILVYNGLIRKYRENNYMLHKKNVLLSAIQKSKI